MEKKAKEYIDTQLNQVKMCLICNEEEYSETNVILHVMHGLHSTKGLIWAPTKGHPLYERHMIEIKRVTKTQ